jgi:hypothetical protein
MSELLIDRLTLRMPGISADDGKRLAQHVSGQLAATDFSQAQLAASERNSLVVNVSATPGMALEHTARLIVADVIRQLSRS